MLKHELQLFDAEHTLFPGKAKPVPLLSVEYATPHPAGLDTNACLGHTAFAELSETHFASIAHHVHPNEPEHVAQLFKVLHISNPSGPIIKPSFIDI
jgi:hypothetical protein